MIALAEIRSHAPALPEVQEGPPVPAAQRVAAFKVAGKSFLGVEKGLRVDLSRVSAERVKKLIDRS